MFDPRQAGKICILSDKNYRHVEERNFDSYALNIAHNSLTVFLNWCYVPYTTILEVLMGETATELFYFGYMKFKI